MTREEAIAILEVSKHMATSGRMYNQAIDMAIESLSESRGDLISRADAIGCVDYWIDDDATDDAQARAVAIKNALRYRPSDDAVNRHYIKIYADDEPSVKAEKLYQICGETQNREVTEWLKEYFSSAEHDGCDGCRYEHNTEYEYPCSECKQAYKDMWEQKPNDFIEVVRCKDCKQRRVEGD